MNNGLNWPYGVNCIGELCDKICIKAFSDALRQTGSWQSVGYFLSEKSQLHERGGNSACH